MARIQGQQDNQGEWPTFYIASVIHGGKRNIAQLFYEWRDHRGGQQLNPLIARIFHPFYALTQKVNRWRFGPSPDFDPKSLKEVSKHGKTHKG